MSTVFPKLFLVRQDSSFPRVPGSIQSLAFLRFGRFFALFGFGPFFGFRGLLGLFRLGGGRGFKPFASLLGFLRRFSFFDGSWPLPGSGIVPSSNFGGSLGRGRRWSAALHLQFKGRDDLRMQS